MAEPSIQASPRLAAVTGPAPAASPADGRGRALSENEYTAVAVVAVLAGALALVGFVNSFSAIEQAARPEFGNLAFTVPLAIDLGIAVFAALDITLARLDMRIRWLRLIPWGLTAATIYLNVAGQTAWFGRIAHAVLPGLWVVAVEVAAHVVRLRAGLASGRRMDEIRTSRWLLAPWPTLKLRRRMVLWEIRSYPDALSRERDRLLSLTDLQDTYGCWRWRWKAPRRTRALYRLGELTPAGAPVPVAAPADPAGDGPVTARQPGGRAVTPARRPNTGRRPARQLRAAPDVEDLMPAGRQIAAALDAGGRPLTRDNLRTALREQGHTASSERVGALLTRLRDDPPADLAQGDPR